MGHTSSLARTTSLSLGELDCGTFFSNSSFVLNATFCDAQNFISTRTPAELNERLTVYQVRRCVTAEFSSQHKIALFTLQKLIEKGELQICLYIACISWVMPFNIFWVMLSTEHSSHYILYFTPQPDAQGDAKIDLDRYFCAIALFTLRKLFCESEIYYESIKLKLVQKVAEPN